jgi:hypothetical protein
MMSYRVNSLNKRILEDRKNKIYNSFSCDNILDKKKLNNSLKKRRFDNFSSSNLINKNYFLKIRKGIESKIKIQNCSYQLEKLDVKNFACRLKRVGENEYIISKKNFLDFCDDMSYLMKNDDVKDIRKIANSVLKKFLEKYNYLLVSYDQSTDNLFFKISYNILKNTEKKFNKLIKEYMKRLNTNSMFIEYLILKDINPYYFYNVLKKNIIFDETNNIFKFK